MVSSRATSLGEESEEDEEEPAAEGAEGCSLVFASWFVLSVGGVERRLTVGVVREEGTQEGEPEHLLVREKERS